MKPSAYISDGGILFKESPPDSILKLNPLYTSAEIQALHNLLKEQDKKIIDNNAVGVPNPDGWELTTDSSDVATWKAYEEVRFNPDLIHRWVREGDAYVNRMTKEQMEGLKQHWSEPQTDLIVLLREEVTLMQKYLQEQNLREHFVTWRQKK
jgi:hypothetical protein